MGKMLEECRKAALRTQDEEQAMVDHQVVVLQGLKIHMAGGQGGLVSIDHQHVAALEKTNPVQECGVENMQYHSVHLLTLLGADQASPGVLCASPDIAIK